MSAKTIKISIQVTHIHCHVWYSLGAIDENGNIFSMGLLNDLLYRINGAKCIGNLCQCN